jgi:hypothetical protein
LVEEALIAGIPADVPELARLLGVLDDKLWGSEPQSPAARRIPVGTAGFKYLGATRLARRIARALRDSSRTCQGREFVFPVRRRSSPRRWLSPLVVPVVGAACAVGTPVA